MYTINLKVTTKKTKQRIIVNKPTEKIVILKIQWIERKAGKKEKENSEYWE